MKEPATDSYGWMRQVGTLLSIPFVLGLSPVVGSAIGWVMDRVFGTRPLFMVLGLLLGVAAGVRETWFIIRQVSKDEKKNAKDSLGNS